MARSRNRAPRWFWIAAILLLLWGMMGVTAFYFDVAATEHDIALALGHGRFQWNYDKLAPQTCEQ